MPSEWDLLLVMGDRILRALFAVTLFLSAVLLSSLPNLPRVNLHVAGAFFALSAVLIFRPVFFTYMGYGYHSDEQTVPLALPRAADLRILQKDATLYEELIPFVQRLADGQAIVAAPDCPEVYFLSGFTNPTSVLSSDEASSRWRS